MTFNLAAQVVARARAATYRIPASSAGTVLVKSAKVSPKSAGTKSIAVSCRRTQTAARGDVRLCASSVNRKSGRVTVKTFGQPNVVVTVTITATDPQSHKVIATWARSWKVRAR